MLRIPGKANFPEKIGSRAQDLNVTRERFSAWVRLNRVQLIKWKANWTLKCPYMYSFSHEIKFYSVKISWKASWVSSGSLNDRMYFPIIGRIDSKSTIAKLDLIMLIETWVEVFAKNVLYTYTLKTELVMIQLSCDCTACILHAVCRQSSLTAPQVVVTTTCCEDKVWHHSVEPNCWTELLTCLFPYFAEWCMTRFTEQPATWNPSKLFTYLLFNFHRALARDVISNVHGAGCLPLHRWLSHVSARLQYLHCISNGDTAVLHF